MLKISILELSIVGVLGLFWFGLVLFGSLPFFVSFVLGFFASPRSYTLCLPLNVNS